ncbi:hypothetical protein M422DRAFT_252441 [Sphaerobolus stellatus SS14]|uniref:Unplaced genomic scaffold SPHSTscaffold_44, whole genome shotgun sequence n=1 Tax=Sphaerobolus stellatus (strain SS14) TaxID=990650 RepID=A0A0C9VAH5_SPHS4|nr:hypothetical protein M422DRAFT_252441 [Sphaerobolus stellatus SS14]
MRFPAGDVIESRPSKKKNIRKCSGDEMTDGPGLSSAKDEAAVTESPDRIPDRRNFGTRLREFENQTGFDGRIQVAWDKFKRRGIADTAMTPARDRLALDSLSLTVAALPADLYISLQWATAYPTQRRELATRWSTLAISPRRGFTLALRTGTTRSSPILSLTASLPRFTGL